jgi:[ribosomal protein S5]-alanine N-acetyltransferase
MIVLETPRLLLRSVMMADFPDMHRLHTDPLVVRSIWCGAVPSEDDTRAKMELYLANWRRHGFGFFSVFLKPRRYDPATFAGRGGLRYFRGTADIEYGLCLFGHLSGQGIAPELGAAVLSFAFTTLQLDRVVGIIRPENIRSFRALSKNGFRHLEDRQYPDGVKGFYEVRREAFEMMHHPPVCITMEESRSHLGRTAAG